MPCRAMTSDRVANGFPVMRSIWAKSEAVANEDNKARRASRFIPQIICHPERSRGTPSYVARLSTGPSPPLRFAQDDEDATRNAAPSQDRAARRSRPESEQLTNR